MKTKIYKFDPVLYPFPILVCKYIPGVTATEISDNFLAVIDRNTLQKFDKDELVANPTLIAKTICVVEKESNQMYYLVILYQPKKILCGVVSHESLHVVTMIGDWLGINPPTVTNDKPHAYLLQWVANCIWSVLKGHPDDMDGELL